MTIALDEVVAVVTGAAGGIGREVVKAMKAAGAIVIATDLPDSADVGADHYLHPQLDERPLLAALLRDLAARAGKQADS